MAATALALGFGVATAAIAVKKSKQKLARIIAEALSEYFEVEDPDETVETKLRSDGKVVLTNLRLKPLFPPQAGIKVEGVVENAEFTWNWGGSSYVRNATLTVRGAHIRISKTKNVMNSSKEGTAQQAADTAKPGGAGGDDNGGDATVQQILDHLAINVSNMTVTFELGGSENDDHDASNTDVVAAAKSIQLVSLGRENDDVSLSDYATVNPPLLQRLVNEAFSVYIVYHNDNAGSSPKKLPLIEPVSYTYDVKRVAGQRFQGIESGLEVSSSRNPAEQGLTVHAGTAQVKALLLLQDMLLVSSSPDDKSSSSAASPSSSTKNTVAVADPDSSTLLVVAVPFLKFMLPQNASFTLPDLKLHYRTDGAVCSVQAAGGMLVNDVYPAIALEDCTSFLVDLNKKTFHLDYHDVKAQQAMSKEVALFTLKEKEIVKLVAGMRELLDVVDEAAAAAADSKDVVDMNPSDSSSPPWSFALKGGSLVIRVESNDAESPDVERKWFQASLDAPSTFVLPNRPGELPSEISIGGASLGPTSFGDFVMQISNATMTAKSFPWTSVDDMQQFLMRAMGLDGWK